MTLIPTKRQWKKWSLPSRVSYIGFVLTIMTLGLSLVFYYWSRGSDGISNQPQLSVGFSGKPYLRYSKPSGSGITLSYEICVKNSGNHPAKNLQYMKATQTLQVGDDPPVVVDSLPSVRAPARLVSGAHYCQILMMSNPRDDPTQIARITAGYNSGHVAILLELKLRYYDAFTEKEFFFEERNTVKKDRVDID